MLEVSRDSEREQIESILRDAKSILLLDWPSRELPDSLARAGYEVTAHVGPGPFDYSMYEATDSEIVVRSGLPAPEHVDSVHVFRPIEELTSIAAMSEMKGATSIWYQSGRSEDRTTDSAGCWLSEGDSAKARRIVETHGLKYIERPHILEAIASLA
jgi:predicted CoA-binding protein